MAYITEYQYYENTGNPNTEDGNWGSYPYVSVNDSVRNFILVYVGKDTKIKYNARKQIAIVELRAIHK